MLQCPEVVQSPFLPRRELLLDTLETVRRGELVADFVLITFGQDLMIGSGEGACRWVETLRQLAHAQVAGPFEASVAGYGEQAVMPRTDRGPGGGNPADVAVDVGIDEV